MKPLVRTRVGGRRAVVLGTAQRELWPDPASTARLRPSRGGAILSGPWLLRAAVLLPREHGLVQAGAQAAARWLGEVHRRWLQAQGIAGATVYMGRPTSHWASFAQRAPGEVLVGERKLVAIAQASTPQAVLLSSGVLIAPPPWFLLCSTLHRPNAMAALLEALSVSATECLGRVVDAQAWADGLRHALCVALSCAGLPANAQLHVGGHPAPARDGFMGWQFCSHQPAS